MDYRVYDIENKKFLHRDDVFVSGFNEDLYIYKKSLFGKGKLEMLPKDKYVVHRSTGVVDKYGVPIFEGDVCEVEWDGEDDPYDDVGKLTVAFMPEQASYLLFDDKNSKYYHFVSIINDKLVVIGTVFDDDFNADGGKE